MLFFRSDRRREGGGRIGSGRGDVPYLTGERTARHVLPVEPQLDRVVLCLAGREADRVSVLTLRLGGRWYAAAIDRHLQIARSGLGCFDCGDGKKQ